MRQARVTHRLPGQTSTVPSDIAKLARRIDDHGDPGEALEAIVAIRRRLDDLEAVKSTRRSGRDGRGAGSPPPSRSPSRRPPASTRGAGGPRSRPRPLRLRRPSRRPGRAASSRSRARPDGSSSTPARSDSPGAAGVGLEHLLLGLLHSPPGKAAGALAAAGVALEPARAQIDALASEEGRLIAGESPGGRRPPVLPEARQVFEQALREAVAQGDAHLGVEHMLLALVSAEGAGAATVLARLEVGRTAVLRSVRDVLARR